MFTKVTNSQPLIDYLAETLRHKLAAGQNVLWLVAGGSAIPVVVAIAQKLNDIDVAGLTVMVTDERYGAVGHTDSNWHQLQQAGLRLPSARLVPVLQGHSIEDTTTEFANHLQTYCQEADYRVGLFGIGPDGHTAGILPHSSAVAASDWAAYYQGPDFPRVTMTAPAIAALDEAVVYAMGDAKRQALTDLQHDLPAEDQPAQILKKVHKLTIFNDQIGDAA